VEKMRVVLLTASVQRRRLKNPHFFNPIDNFEKEKAVVSGKNRFSFFYFNFKFTLFLLVEK
jgi:hypothetical protein